MKEVAMKSFLLLIVLMAVADQVQAQALNKDLQKMRDEFWQKRQGKVQLSVPIVKPGQGSNAPVFQKPGVYALPQDGMPCIVPNTADIAAIPNAMPQKPVVPFRKIPNAAPKIK